MPLFEHSSKLCSFKIRNQVAIQYLWKIFTTMLCSKQWGRTIKGPWIARNQIYVTLWMLKTKMISEAKSWPMENNPNQTTKWQRSLVTTLASCELMFFWSSSYCVPHVSLSSCGQPSWRPPASHLIHNCLKVLLWKLYSLWPPSELPSTAISGSAVCDLQLSE